MFLNDQIQAARRDPPLLRMNIIDCEVSMAEMVCVLMAVISVEAFVRRPGGTR
jgi:hypothetical protein